MSDAVDTAVVTPPARSKLLPIVLGINSLLLLGVMGVLVMKSNSLGASSGASSEQAPPAPAPKGDEDDAPAGPAAVAGPTVRLPDFVVRLRNPEQDRFARISFEVELATDPDKERITVRTAKIRDAFIRYLSDRTVEELRGSEGLERTKEELKVQLKELAPDARIRALYITDFVVQ